MEGVRGGFLPLRPKRKLAKVISGKIFVFLKKGRHVIDISLSPEILPQMLMWRVERQQVSYNSETTVNRMKTSTLRESHVYYWVHWQNRATLFCLVGLLPHAHTFSSHESAGVYSSLNPICYKVKSLDPAHTQVEEMHRIWLPGIKDH